MPQCGYLLLMYINMLIARFLKARKGFVINVVSYLSYSKLGRSAARFDPPPPPPRIYQNKNSFKITDS